MNTSHGDAPTFDLPPPPSTIHDEAAAILVEAATPDLYQRNGFRVLDLPVDASAREISRRKQTVEKALIHSLPLPPGLGSYFPLIPMPDQFAVREAMQRLSDPERRLVDELFWFWPHQQGEADTDEALSRLREGKHGEAEGAWLEQEAGLSESFISAHNLAVLYHLRALEQESEYLQKPSGGSIDGVDRLWDKSFRRWQMLVNQEGFWSRLTARIRELDDPRLTAGTARRIRTALPSALLSICGQLALEAAECGRKDSATRLSETIRKSGFSDNDIKQGLELAIDPVRKRIKALCKGAEISAENDPVHADQTCQQLLGDSKPLLEGLDCLLSVGHPTRDVAHDEVADRALRCQVKFAKKTNDWKKSVELLEQSLAIAASESVRKELQEQLEVVRKHAEKADDFCGAGYFDAPTSLLRQMEQARQMADRHDYDSAVQSLDGLLAGQDEGAVSAPYLPLVNKALAYCLGCRAIGRVNTATGEWNAFDTSVITAIRDRAARDLIDSTAWMCARLENIPQYTFCKCMACGMTISSRYTVLKYTFNKDKGPVTVIMCGACGDRHRNEMGGVRANLKTAVQQSAQDYVDAAALDPANKFVQEQVAQTRKLCSTLEISMPLPKRGKAKNVMAGAAPPVQPVAPAASGARVRATEAQRWAVVSLVAGLLALVLPLLLLKTLLAVSGVVCGHVAVRKLKRCGKQSSPALARVGLILSYLLLLSLLAAILPGHRITQSSRGSIEAPITTALTNPANGNPIATIEGTTWTFKETTGEQYRVRFDPNGIVQCTSHAGSICSNATWRLDGETIQIKSNKGDAQFRGQLTGTHMEGTASNNKWRQWAWTADQTNPAHIATQQPVQSAGNASTTMPDDRHSIQESRTKKVATHIAKAKAFWSSGHIHEAIAECDAALQLDANNEEASALRDKYQRAQTLLNGTSQ